MYEIFNNLIKTHNISLYKISKETGIAYSTLSDWKNGKTTPKHDKLIKIADYLNVSVEFLMGIKEDESSNIVLNNEAKEIAQNISLNDDLKELFELTKNMQPKRLKAYIDLIKKIQE